MRNLLLGLITLAWLTFTVAAQTPPEVTPEQARLYQSTFDGSMKAHQAAKYDDAIAGFTKCLTILPEESTCAYNIACGHSQKGDLDAAFEWLEKSIGWGFGETNIEQDEIALAEKTDTDLAPLRADPRFAKAIDRMKAQAKAIDEFASRPAVYVPAALEGVAELPVLVVLHDAGSTKDALLDSQWKSVADELGIALVMPSGREAVAHEPTKGMTWFSNAQLYIKSTFKYERTINAAVDLFKKDRKIDKTRLFIAGEGQGGILAFNVAISSPGLYKGVLTFDAPVITQLASAKAANAAKMGFRGKVFENKAGIYGAPKDADIAKLVEDLGKSLASLKLDRVSVAAYALDPAQPDLRKNLALDALREFLTPPKPAEAAPVK